MPNTGPPTPALRGAAGRQTGRLSEVRTSAVDIEVAEVHVVIE
ncbi:hypothetical protein [Streptomyces sp. NRRL S-87]|nr:hypothetical protein [Streptomyces sp. NRRL S-87]